MKKTITLILMSFNLNAGNVNIYNNNVLTQVIDECEISFFQYSDQVRITQFTLHCDYDNIMPIIQDTENSTFIMINNQLQFLCPVESSFVNGLDNFDFTINLDCSDLIFKDGFE